MSNEYLDWLNDLRDAPEGTPDHNHWLCLMFPWLYPYNKITEDFSSNYNYEYTLLDDMPDGWRKAFGEQMCFEIAEVLEKTKDENFEYRILQIKEKWGTLRWYDNSVPDDIRDELKSVIQKYEDLSEKTCINCGASAKWRTTNWISPWCDKCVCDINDTIKKI